MGWTSFATDKTFEEVFKDEFNGLYQKVLAFNKTFEVHSGIDYDSDGNATCDHCVIYAAVEHEECVFGLVVLFTKRDGDIYYKEMDESMEPFFYKMSEGVFSYLTDIPDQSKRSKTWRRKVRNKLGIDQYKLEL